MDNIEKENRIAKLNNAAEKAFRKAQRLQRRAINIANNNLPIYPSDDDAEERLRTKIDELEKHQKFLAGVNKILHFPLMGDQAKVQMLINDMDMNENDARKILMPDENGLIGFSKKTIHNNSARLHNYRKQLEKVSALKAGKYKTYQINGITVEEVPAKDSFRIRFDSDPGAEIKKMLHSAGFAYSFYLKCWITHMNPKLIERGKKILEGL